MHQRSEMREKQREPNFPKYEPNFPKSNNSGGYGVESSTIGILIFLAVLIGLIIYWISR